MAGTNEQQGRGATSEQAPPQPKAETAKPRVYGELVRGLAKAWGVSEDDVMRLAVSFIAVKEPSTRVPYEKCIEFLMICAAHKLNPATREIGAFYGYNEKQGWRLQTFIEVDGWVKLANQHPEYDGFTQEFHFRGQDRLADSVTTRVFRKGRSHPEETTIFMDEWKKDTPVWRQMPNWQLGVKGIKQTVRFAFGFAGIVDREDLLEESDTAPVTVSTQAQPQTINPGLPDKTQVAPDIVQQAAQKKDERPLAEVLGVKSKTPPQGNSNNNYQAAPQSQPEVEPSGTDTPPVESIEDGELQPEDSPPPPAEPTTPTPASETEKKADIASESRKLFGEPDQPSMRDLEEAEKKKAAAAAKPIEKPKDEKPRRTPPTPKSAQAFGDWVKAHRRAKSLTLSQCADRFDLTVAILQDIEKGEPASILGLDESDIMKIADGLKSDDDKEPRANLLRLANRAS